MDQTVQDLERAVLAHLKRMNINIGYYRVRVQPCPTSAKFIEIGHSFGLYGGEWHSMRHHPSCMQIDIDKVSNQMANQVYRKLNQKQ